MADWVKMGIKAGIIITVTALVIVLLSTITFPSVDLTAFIQGIGKGKAIMTYWFPLMGTLFNIFLGLMALELITYGIYIALIGIRWILKVNE